MVILKLVLVNWLNFRKLNSLQYLFPEFATFVSSFSFNSIYMLSILSSMIRDQSNFLLV